MRHNNLLLGVVLGTVLVAIGILAYLYYERSEKPVVTIDVPGVSGEISKDKGVDIDVGKPKN
jgi:hypothetical protein